MSTSALRPSCSDQPALTSSFEEGADDLADLGGEVSSVLRDPLVIAVRLVDLPVHRLDGTEQIGGVEHLRSATDRGFELRSLG